MKRITFYKFTVFFVALTHFTLSAFIALGAILQFYISAVKTIYLPILILMLFPTLSSKYCPLSALERWLRKKYEPQTTYKYFWDFYLQRNIRLPKSVQYLVFFLLLGLGIIARFI